LTCNTRTIARHPPCLTEDAAQRRYDIINMEEMKMAYPDIHRPTVAGAARRRAARLAWWPAGVGVLFVLLLTGAPSPATAQDPLGEPQQGERRIDGYLVRWNSMVTGFLPQRAIEEHRLEPNGHGVLNVVVLRDRDGAAAPRTVAAEVWVKVTDLLGQVTEIQMRPMRANERVSYLGTFDVEGRGPLRFELQVQPPGEPVATIDFQRRFFGE
jgi:hypothetical protein